MKSKLLLAGILCSALVSGQQNKLKDAGTTDLRKILRPMPQVQEAENNKNETKNPQNAAYSKQTKMLGTGQGWKPFTGSMNVYGVLESSGSPLQYNDELNAVSFIHRKSATYVSSPFPSTEIARSGVIVGMVTQDWGTAWDSTCIWNNSQQLARYPQGGFYAAPNETDINNAYLVASGPVTHPNSTIGWIGSYFASKKIGPIGSADYDSIASTVAGAQQFFANTAPFAPVKKFDYPSYDFTSTDDGYVRSLALVVNNFNSTTPSIRGTRGARVLKGTFNAGTFDWESDSLFPDVHLNTNSNSLDILGDPHMAWNESGSVGYVWFIGCRNGRTGANVGFQPIVFKTSDGGNSWSEMGGINFNDPAFKAPVLDKMPATVDNPTLTIPLFNPTEGIDCVVDKNDRLHIISTVIGTSRSHADSMAFIFRFSNFDGQSYSFAHVPGARPYIYDFTETPTGWDVHVVDSMSSEAPGEVLNSNGYNDNPWDPTGGSSGTDKVPSNARLQASRTPDGQYLVYTFTESDTAFTNLERKWNHLPNIKARMILIGSESGTVAAGYTIHPNEINVSSPGGMTEPQVDGRSHMHYISPKCAVISNSISLAQGKIAIGLPVTVTNNMETPLAQAAPNTHWYSASELKFDNAQVEWPLITGIKNNGSDLLKGVSLFPNPSADQVYLRMPGSVRSLVEISISNIAGQVLVQKNVDSGSGQISLDTRSLPAGMYLVHLKTAEGSVTKKLIKE